MDHSKDQILQAINVIGFRMLDHMVKIYLNHSYKVQEIRRLVAESIDLITKLESKK